MKWCKSCVLPSTRPNLSFNVEGICSGCLNHNKKIIINWTERQSKLNLLINEIKAKSSQYDCLIPVSAKYLAIVCLLRQKGVRFDRTKPVHSICFGIFRKQFQCLVFSDAFGYSFR